MKKRLILLITMGILAVFLTACQSADNDNDAVQSVVDGFYTAAMVSDYSGTIEYISDDFGNLDALLEMSDSEPEDLLDESVSGFGLNADDLSEEVNQTFTNFFEVMLKNVIREYEVSDIQIDGDTATARIEWVTAYADPSEVESYTGMENDLETIVQDYKNTHSADLSMTDEKNDSIIILNALLPEIFTEAAENVANLPDIQMVSVVTLEKTDEEWLIISMEEEGQNAE
ncbi:MAG: hypothetical protein PWP52_903 [Bacteroidales bacterium]|nr:hypothetical protein [Bacteroidales bacterium]